MSLDHVAAPTRSESEVPAAACFRRVVFYIAGFDTLGPRYYERLFRLECAKDARLEGVPFRFRSANRESPYFADWAAETEWPRGRVETRYRFLSLHDIALEHYVTGPVRAIGCWAAALGRALADGLLLRLYRINWKNALFQTYSLALVPLILFLGFVGGWLVPWPVAADWLLPTQLVAGPAAGLAALWLAARFDRWTFVLFAVSALRFGALHADERLPRITQRIADFRAMVAKEFAAETADEILIVGHSYSTALVVDVAADLVPTLPPDPARRPRLGLVTLGSNDWLVSFYRSARRHRAALAAVAARPDVTWVEYHSAWDFLCMDRTDPIRAAGIDLGGRRQCGPQVRRIDFRAMLSRSNYRRMLPGLFRRHFQYFKARDRIAGYSYFRIVCGPDPLG